MATLIVANDAELGDLIEWLTEHPDDCEVPRVDRLCAQAWLLHVDKTTADYPAFIELPAEYAPAITGVIEDWSEVLGAHDDDFHTYVNSEV